MAEKGGISEVQERYARVLLAGKRAGLFCLVASFVLYLSGWCAPHVPLARLPDYWGLPVEEYLAATGSPAGWGWLALAGHGDFMNLAGIAVLAGATVACYLSVLPLLVRGKDRSYAVIVALEVMVLLLAASGILKGAGP